jgi:hypothetical protein
MGPVTRLCLRLFVRFFVFFGVSAGIPAVAIVVLLGGPRAGCAGIGVAVMVVAVIVTPLALVTAATQVHAVKKLGLPVTDDTLSTRQVKTVLVNCSYATALERCLAEIRSQPRTVIGEGTKLAEGVIHARTLVSGRSWGEKLEIRLRKRNDDWTRVTVSSRPQFFMRLLDRGHNLRNVERIIRSLQEPGP